MAGEDEKSLFANLDVSKASLRFFDTATVLIFFHQRLILSVLITFQLPKRRFPNLQFPVFFWFFGNVRFPQLFFQCLCPIFLLPKSYHFYRTLRFLKYQQGADSRRCRRVCVASHSNSTAINHETL